MSIYMPTIVPQYFHLDMSKHVMRNVSRLCLRAHTLKVEAAAWLEDGRTPNCWQWRFVWFGLLVFQLRMFCLVSFNKLVKLVYWRIVISQGRVSLEQRLYRLLLCWVLYFAVTVICSDMVLAYVTNVLVKRNMFRTRCMLFYFAKTIGFVCWGNIFLFVYTFFWGLFGSPTLFAATGQQPTCLLLFIYNALPSSRFFCWQQNTEH